MSDLAISETIPLPKSWPQYIKAGVIHAISLAHYGLSFSRSWAASYPGAVTLSGKQGDDAKPYQEKQIRRAIEEVQE